LILSQKERIMTDRTRPDDSEIIDAMEDAPAFGGSSGGNLQREIGARDELDEEAGDGDGVTRVRGSDKPEQADLPRFNPK
jgi:hypothetical protein